MGLVLSAIPLWGRLLVVGLAMVAAAGFGALKMHTYDQARYDTLEVAYSQFKADVKAQGVISQRLADAQTAKDQADKELADAQNLKSIAALHNTITGLRKRAAANDSRGGSLSASPSGSTCPTDQTCFETSAYQRAIGDFDRAARQLADSCSEVEADFATIQEWAQKP